MITSYKYMMTFSTRTGKALLTSSSIYYRNRKKTDKVEESC